MNVSPTVDDDPDSDGLVTAIERVAQLLQRCHVTLVAIAVLLVLLIAANLD